MAFKSYCIFALFFILLYVILWLEVIAKEKLPSFGIHACMYHCELKAGSRFNHFVYKLVVRCACLLPISEIYTDQFAGCFICSRTALTAALANHGSLSHSVKCEPVWVLSFRKKPNLWSIWSFWPNLFVYNADSNTAWLLRCTCAALCFSRAALLSAL